MTMKIVFINCLSLYPLGRHPRRGPKTASALNRKISNLASTLRAASAGALPDIIGLAEVGSEKIGIQLAEAMSPGTYTHEWSEVPMGMSHNPQTGLMVLYKTTMVSATGRTHGKDTAQFGSRHKWFAVELQTGPTPASRFWFVVNHWSSGYRKTPDDADDLRVTSAREIGEFFATLAGASEAAVLVGDFNCDPYARPFTGEARTDRLYSIRERSLVLRDRNLLFYVYNPMWRLLGEHDAHEVASVPGYTEPRPPGTYPMDKSNVGNWRNWRTWDQILVSKALLAKGPLLLLENTLRVQKPIRRCSDHCAVAVAFQ